MPYEVSSSPVAPRAGSRLWTVGASAGIADRRPARGGGASARLDAVWLFGAAVLVGLSTWTIRPDAAVDDGSARRPEIAEPPIGPRVLLDSVFEALADPVLVVSGGEADDIAGRRIVLANAAARDLLRIQREGALLVSALRDPGGAGGGGRGPVRRPDRAPPTMRGVGAQTRHWRALARPLPSAGRQTAGPAGACATRPTCGAWS